jgi:chromosome segregation ATPase
MEKGVQCELCEEWFHCKCEGVLEETYKIMKQEKVHFYCGRCDKNVVQLLKTVLDLKTRQDRLEDRIQKNQDEVKETIQDFVRKLMEEAKTKNENIEKLEKSVKDLKKEITKVIQDQAKWRDDISRMKNEINVDIGVVRQKLDVVKTSITREDRRDINEDEDFKKLEKEVSALKTELESKVKKTVIGVKENVEETLEIERRKMNLVIHGVPETDAEQDIKAVSEILGTGLHMDFERHVVSVMRIGRIDENRSRPIRLGINSMDGKR